MNIKYLTENLSGFFQSDPKGYCLSSPAIFEKGHADYGEEIETKTDVPVIPEDSVESSSYEDIETLRGLCGQSETRKWMRI